MILFIMIFFKSLNQIGFLFPKFSCFSALLPIPTVKWFSMMGFLFIYLLTLIPKSNFNVLMSFQIDELNRWTHKLCTSIYEPKFKKVINANRSSQIVHTIHICLYSTKAKIQQFDLILNLLSWFMLFVAGAFFIFFQQ